MNCPCGVGCGGCSDGLEIKDAEIARLTEQLAQWKSWGIVEIAVRNQNVADYVEHWEGRTTKAEEQLAAVWEALRENEWSNRPGVYRECPACENYIEHGHRKDCWLVKALADSAPPVAQVGRE